MGVELRISARESVDFVFPISRSDWSLVERLKTECPNEIAIIFGSDELGISERLVTAELADAVRRVIEVIASRSELLPATFQFKLERAVHPMATSGGFETGAISGIRLPGDLTHAYSLRAGVDECYLQKIGIDSDGRGRLVEQIDMRDHKEIITETFGKILIRRTKKKTDLNVCLTLLLKYLQSVASNEIVRTLN